MKAVKQDLFHLDTCYAVKAIEVDHEWHVVFAPNSKGPAVLFNLSGEKVASVWEETGGVMSVVPLPGKNGDFLAVQRFFPGFAAADAQVVSCTHQGKDRWRVDKLFDLPYLHRFDILQHMGRSYLMAGVLCRSKQHKDDWSDPGYIAVAELGQDFTPVSDFLILQDGLTKNHGYGKVVHAGVEKGLFSSQEGVFLVSPPSGPSADWTVTRLFDQPTSEARLYDIDNDGVEELITIEPFHGSHLRIYKPEQAGYRLMYECEEPMDFYHVIWTGTLRGRKGIISAGRLGAQRLFFIDWQPGTGFRVTLLDEKVGVSNVDVLPGDDYDLLASANTSSGLATFYRVYD